METARRNFYSFCRNCLFLQKLFLLKRPAETFTVSAETFGCCRNCSFLQFYLAQTNIMCRNSTTKKKQSAWVVSPSLKTKCQTSRLETEIHRAVSSIRSPTFSGLPHPDLNLGRKQNEKDRNSKIISPTVCPHQTKRVSYLCTGRKPSIPRKTNNQQSNNNH